MLEVELLDDDGAPAPSPEHRRIPRRWIVVAGIATVITVALTQWVGVARERAAVARLAEVPGVLRPVDDTLVVARRVSPAELGVLDADTGGVVDVAGDGSQTITWNGWTTELSGADERFADAEGDVLVGTTCELDSAPGAEPSTASHLVCLVTDGGSIVDGGSGFAEVPATARRVVVLSADDGTVLAQWPVDRGDSMALFSGGVVLGSATPRDITLTAYVSLTGEQRWSHVDRQPEGFALSDSGVRYVSIFRAGELLGYAPSGGSLQLVGADGTVVRRMSDTVGDGSWGWMTDPRTGLLVMQSVDATGSPLTTFVAADGDPESDVTVDGQPLQVTVDDGSVRGLLLTSADGVHAWDAGSGASRWTHDVGVVSNALVLRGGVYLATSREVVALDGRTGRVLWTTGRATDLEPRGVLTDGQHVLAALGGATPALVAYDPAGGHEVFRAPYPPGVTEVTAIGRRLVGRDLAADEYEVLE